MKKNIFLVETNFKLSKNRLTVLMIILVLFIPFSENCTKSTEPDNSNQPILVLTCSGNDLSVGNYATLDGSKSTSGGGDTLIFTWEADDDNPVVVPMYGEKVQNLGFIKEGLYKFRLTIDNGTSNSTEEVEINIKERDKIIFEDPSLELQVRYALKIPSEELMESDLLNIDSLSRAIFAGEDIYSLKGLENCKNLVYMQLGLENISDITSLSTLIHLKYLNLTQNRQISDLTPLKNLQELEYLSLDRNIIEDISILQNLNKLTYLNLLDNPIEDLFPINSLTELEELWLSYTNDGNLSFLTGLNNLYLLWMTSCNIEEIELVKDLEDLRRINFDGNNIVDLSPLISLKKLEWLYLDKNQISDITPLESLENLSRLRLWNNQITDISSLVRNKGFGEGDNIGLFGNPLNEISINEYIPALKARGVNIEW